MRFSPISMIGYYGIRLKIWSLAFQLRVLNYKRSFHSLISPECHGVFNHQQHACLFNSSCRITPKKLSKLHLVLVLGMHLWPVDSTHKGAAVDIVYMSSCHTTKVLDWATHSQWVNSVPPYVRKLHFMYEAIRTSGKCRWNIYRTSSKCRCSIYRTSRKRRGTFRIVHKVEWSSPTVTFAPNGACCVPSYCLWTSADWYLICPLGTNFRWILIKNTSIFQKENKSKDVTCKIVTILCPLRVLYSSF